MIENFNLWWLIPMYGAVIAWAFWKLHQHKKEQAKKDGSINER